MSPIEMSLLPRHHHHHRQQHDQGAEHEQRNPRLRKGVVATNRGAGPSSSNRGPNNSNRGFNAPAPCNRGPSTPVPTWKLYENPSFEGVAPAGEDEEEEENEEEEEEEGEEMRRNSGARTAAMAFTHQQEDGDPAAAVGGRRLLVSARKLAATLWEELQQEEAPTISVSPAIPLLPLHSPSKKNAPFSSRIVSSSSPSCQARVLEPPDASPRSHLQSRPSSISDSPDSANQHHRQRFYSHIQTSSTLQTSSLPTKASHPSSLSPTLQTITLMRPAHPCESTRSRLNSSPIQHSPAQLLDGLEPSEDCRMVFSRPDPFKLSNRPLLSDVEASASLIFTLQMELQRAHAHVKELELAQKSAERDVESLLKRCAEEYSMLRNREQEKIQVAVLSINEELEKERKARKKLESENRKLSIHLAEANRVTVQTEKELDKERKARQLMEDVCDELAREIGEDKAEVEELKREHAKAKEELEEERRMLQMAEAWREERVQMKLSEAKLDVEERCMALNDLKSELANVLNAWKTLYDEARDMEDLDADRIERLIDAAEELRGRASAPLCLMEDATGYPSQSLDNAGTSDIDSVRNVLSNLHNASEDSEWVKNSHTFGHINAQGRSWTSRRLSSRRKRSVPCIKSHGSRIKGLDRLGDKDRGAFDWRDQDNMAVIYYGGEQSRSGKDSSSEFGYEGTLTGVESDEPGTAWQYSYEGNACIGEKESTWGGDHGHERRGLREDGGNWHSYNEENDVLETPLTLCRPLDSVVEDETNAEHDAKATNGRSAKAIFQGDTYSKNETNLSSAEGCSLRLKQFAHSPNFKPSTASWPFAEHCESHSVSQGRRVSVEGPIDWSKPFRSNSLQAKLLLEDRMETLEHQARQPKGSKSRR